MAIPSLQRKRLVPRPKAGIVTALAQKGKQFLAIVEVQENGDTPEPVIVGIRRKIAPNDLNAFGQCVATKTPVGVVGGE